MIKLTQILHNEGDEDSPWIEKPVLLNPDYVQSVQVCRFERKGPAILGQEHDREVIRIHLRDGQFIYATESFEDVQKAILG